MLGSILYIDNKQGFIQGEDEKRYYFVDTDWLGSSTPIMGMAVIFRVDDDKARDVHPQGTPETVGWGQPKPQSSHSQPGATAMGTPPGNDPPNNAFGGSSLGATLNVPIPNREQTNVFFQSFLTFDRMIAPTLITIWYYVTLAACLLFGFWTFMSGIFGENYLRWVKIPTGLGALILGPLAARLTAEFVIVIFKIHTRLKSLDDKTRP